MKRRSLAEAVIAAAALLALYGGAQIAETENADTGIIAADAGNTVDEPIVSQETQEGESDSDAMDYTGMDAGGAASDEGSLDDVSVEMLNDMDEGSEFERNFYEKNKEMDFDQDGEITRNESRRWSFVQADLKSEVTKWKMTGVEAILYVDQYVNAYMDLDEETYESLSPAQQADCLETAYNLMCSDKGMTMEELGDLIDCDLEEKIQNLPAYFEEHYDPLDYVER